MTDALPVRLYDTGIGTLERTARGGVVLRWSREAIDRRTWAVSAPPW